MFTPGLRVLFYRVLHLGPFGVFLLYRKRRKRREREREREREVGKREVERERESAEKKRKHKEKNKRSHPTLIISVFGIFVLFVLFFWFHHFLLWGVDLSRARLVPCSFLPPPLFGPPKGKFHPFSLGRGHLGTSSCVWSVAVAVLLIVCSSLFWCVSFCYSYLSSPLVVFIFLVFFLLLYYCFFLFVFIIFLVFLSSSIFLLIIILSFAFASFHVSSTSALLGTGSGT